MTIRRRSVVPFRRHLLDHALVQRHFEAAAGPLRRGAAGQRNACSVPGGDQVSAWRWPGDRTQRRPCGLSGFFSPVSAASGRTRISGSGGSAR